MARLRLEHHQSLGSTSDRARQLAGDGDFGPVWIQADQQTQGRGRLGRNWVSPKGNLYCTGLYPAFKDPRQTAQLGFAAVLAAYDVAQQYVPDVALGLKWPNDLQIDGAKLCGILLESGHGKSGEPFVTIGVGMNLISAPDLPDYAATSLAAHLDITDPEEIPHPRSACAILAARFDHWRDILIEEGFEPLRSEWTSRAVGMGRDITATYQGQRVIGIMQGLDPDGALLLRLPEQGQVRISSGEVFLTE